MHRSTNWKGKCKAFVFGPIVNQFSYWCLTSNWAFACDLSAQLENVTLTVILFSWWMLQHCCFSTLYSRNASALQQKTEISPPFWNCQKCSSAGRFSVIVFWIIQWYIPFCTWLLHLVYCVNVMAFCQYKRSLDELYSWKINWQYLCVHKSKPK